MSKQDNNQQRINPEKLYETLARQITLTEEFLEIIDEEKTALTEMDMQALIALSQKKEQQLTRIQHLDATLQEEAQRLRPELAGKIVKIDALTPFLSPEEGQRLANYKEQLGILRDEILTRNLFNKKFAADTRSYLDDAIQLITSAFSDTTNSRPMYSTTGSEKQLSTQPSLLSREV